MWPASRSPDAISSSCAQAMRALSGPCSSTTAATLLSLAGLTARLFHLAREGPDGARRRRKRWRSAGFTRALAWSRACARTATHSSVPLAARGFDQADRRAAAAGARAAPRPAVRRGRGVLARAARRARMPPPSCARRPRRWRFTTSTGCATSRRRDCLRCASRRGKWQAVWLDRAVQHRLHED